jgi:hypothetical protein
MARKNKFIVLICLYALIGSAMLVVRPEGKLDTRFYYTLEEALSWFHSLSRESRANYVLFELLDLGYIVVYSAIAYLLLGKWALIPGLLDLGENIPVLLYLHGKVDLPEHLGIVTCLKWITGTVMIICGIWKVVRRVQARTLK